MLASHALMLLGVPIRRVLRRVQATRQSRYHVLRGVFRGGLPEEGDGPDRPLTRLHSVLIVQGARSIGHALGELAIDELGVEVSAIRRRGVKSLAPSAETRIERGDVVVLFGPDDMIAAAEIRLLQGWSRRRRFAGGMRPMPQKSPREAGLSEDA